MLLPALRHGELKETENLKIWSAKLIDFCKENLADIITFDNKELEFLNNIIEHRKMTPEIIAQEAGLIAFIKQHPVLPWKTMNVREYNCAHENS